MANALLRHWQMLRLIPRAPRKRSTAMLRDELVDRGFEVDLRSVQRDLHKLSTSFPLVCDERSKPFGWSWSREAESFEVPGMDLHTALAFRLAEEHLTHLLPGATLAYLAGHFSHAAQVLAETGDEGVPAWLDKVRVIPGGLPMAPPRIDRDVLESVHTALLRGQQLHLRYRPRGAEADRDYLASPHGLVYRESIAYLVCSLWNYEDIVQLALHRVIEAAVDPAPRHLPQGFSLDAYIAAGEFGFRLGEAPLALVARMDGRAAVRLFETPLSDDQRLETLDDGWVVVRATVADTAQLRTWLRGHGALCEVVAPAALRAELARAAAEMSACYGQPTAAAADGDAD